MTALGGHPLLEHPELRLLAQRVAAHQPRLAEVDGNPRRAAVALVFRVPQHGHAELLIIRRAERDGDPWSGQMGLPGGGAHASDESLEATALRETLEETGIDVRRDGHVIGALDELRPRTPVLPAIIVRPFVAVIRADVQLVLNHEVAEALWLPLHVLRDAATQRDSVVHIHGEQRSEPSFVVGPTVVWGMTNRILRSLMQLLD
jgi:8-oxo-dGTP pyrophosphatase MutT (NUDIX family)